MRRAREEKTAIWRSAVTLHPLPAPDVLEYVLAGGHCCLVTDDGGPLSAAVVQALARRGWPVVLWRFPEAVVAPQPRTLPSDITQVQLEAMTESALQEQLALITETCGPVGAFIHLHPAFETADSLFDERERAVVKQVFLLAKHLQPALTGAAARGRVAFMTVTRLDGALGLSGSNDFGVIGAGLPGLVKSLSLEWEEVFCRAVDVAPILAAEDAAQAVIAELDDPDRLLVEVGRGPAGRVTLKRQEPRPAARAPQPISSTALFLVSGGARGVTAECVMEVARRYRSAFILVGRSPAPDGPEPAWSAGAADEKALKQQAMEHLLAAGEHPTPQRVQRMVQDVLCRREIAGTLRAVAEVGGRAVYASADVTDVAALQAAVETARQELAAEGAPSRITGIIHGAGVIADKPIEQKTEADFERVLSVKVEGLQNLLTCVPPEQLEHLLFFSSIVAFYGNVGQADYALANEILNKVACRLRRDYPHCRVLAMDWGPWEGGMVTPALQRLMARRGVEVIPAEMGRALFADALASDEGTTQLVVGNTLARPASPPAGELHTHRIHRRLTLEANPFLRDHVIGGSAVLPVVCAIAWAVNAAEQRYPGYHFFRVERYKTLKGIVFDATLAEDYVLELEEKAKGPDEIAFAALIRSQTADGKPRFHYSMDLTLRRTLPVAPQHTDFDLGAAQSIPGAALYDGAVLFHGPAFRGIERVLTIGPASLTLECVPPLLSPEDQGQFPVQAFNPYFTDATLQSLLIWAHHTYGYGGLPLSIQGGEQYRPVAEGERLYASLSVQAHSQHHLVADVVVHDAGGRVQSRVWGAEITLSPRLKHLFAQNHLEDDHE
ncbi:MAG TPA: SDR family oxidoreductase [Anaerolineae bacterium]|nr:SDR family oxidoreductase [Anaerolineae bacterium]HQM14356.1 SDR family oxidoreductase [Anaerolineae bacterium]